MKLNNFAVVVSESNNLANITMYAKDSDILGMTEEEIYVYFKDYVENLSSRK